MHDVRNGVHRQGARLRRLVRQTGQQRPAKSCQAANRPAHPLDECAAVQSERRLRGFRRESPPLLLPVTLFLQPATHCPTRALPAQMSRTHRQHPGHRHWATTTANTTADIIRRSNMRVARGAP
jgi:hypothetical protein